MEEINKYKLCSKCGFEIPRNSIKCPKCGYDNTNWITKNKNLLFGILMIVIVAALLINNYENKPPNSGYSSSTSTGTSFTHAHPGEKWLIQDSNISVMKTPEAPTDKNAYLNNLTTVIGYGDVVEVISTKGLYWKRVNVLNNSRVYAVGWILSDTVKKSKKIE